jgi:hypothetical protein
VAVRTVLVCAQFAQCAGQCAAVRLVVCELCDNLAVWGSAAVCVCGSALAAVCGSAHSGVRAVIFEPNIPHILIVTYQYELFLRINVN